MFLLKGPDPERQVPCLLVGKYSNLQTRRDPYESKSTKELAWLMLAPADL